MSLIYLLKREHPVKLFYEERCEEKKEELNEEK